MFRIASNNNNIDEYAYSVSEFIRKCIDNVVPIATIKTFPNQKPWIDGNTRMVPSLDGFGVGNVLIVAMGTTSSTHVLMNSLTESAYSSMLLSDAMRNMRDQQNGVVVSFSERRAREGLICVAEVRIAMIQGFSSPGCANDMLIQFRELFSD